jgi:hypothetical protein
MFGKLLCYDKEAFEEKDLVYDNEEGNNKNMVKKFNEKLGEFPFFMSLL